MASELDQKIIQQIEYYYGDINLPRDKFMQEKIKDDDGWISVETLLTFKRLASLSTDPEVIVNAIEKSESDLVKISEDKKKLRRNPEKALPELNDERLKELMSRSAYAKGFPLDESLNDILTFLEPHGPLESCIRRTYKNNKEHQFKGSCFIVFKDVETCKKFVEAESIKYKDTELIRKWENDYLNDKRKEIQERKESKKEKKEKKQNKANKEKTFEFPKGAILHISGIPEEQTLTREEIKEKFKQLSDLEVSYIDYSRGDRDGHVRFAKENDAVEFYKKLTDGEVEVGEIKLKTKVLEGEEEEEFLKKTSDAVLKMRERQKMKNTRGSRKRRGNFNENGQSKQKKKE